MAKKGRKHLDTSAVSTSIDECIIEWLKIKMLEYNALRIEVQATGSDSISILRFGLLAISGLIYFGLSNWDSIISSILVFTVFCPIICYLILMVWVGEVARRYRASAFLYGNIEKAVNSIFQKYGPVLSWEGWLRGENEALRKKRQFKWHRASTVCLFLLTAALSIIVGVIRCHSIVSPFTLTLIVITEYTFFATIFLFVFLIYQRISLW